MKLNKLNIIIVLGLVSIIGILVMQVLWIKESFNAEEKKFSQKAHITLLQVVNKLYEINHAEFPLNNPVHKIANDYYVVNVNNDFDAQVLEYCLRTEFQKANLLTDFEYAVYKCESDEMVYGNYVSFTDTISKKHTVYFPKQQNLIYYFAVRFPKETGYLFSSLRFWFILSGIIVVILIVYVYSIITILQQRKYSALQKDFINNMTHEFKTPLSSILIASGYLHKQEKIRSDEKLEKYTAIILEQGRKLNSHIEKILDIARSDNAPMSLDLQDLEVLPLLEDIVQGFGLRHEQARLQINNTAGAPQIRVDPFHFTNVIYNLLDNSLKYSNGPAEIVVGLSREEGQLRIDVTDNGIGIPAQKLPYVFDKFYRVPDHQAKAVNGFGLGLYYVKKIAALHHWKITIRNNPTQGITVSLWINTTY